MDKVKFYTNSDYAEINSWFKAHGMPSPSADLLPSNGFIVPGVAAGFVYLTDSSVSILDSFISNPDSDDDDRSDAIDWIAIHLTNLAMMNGTKLLICNTKIKAVRDRVLTLGFTDTGKHDSFAKELN
jgi:hypothetical protein